MATTGPNTDTSTKRDHELGALGRYSGPASLILSSLAGGPKHGYALTADIEEFAGVRLQPGTLYGALTRLESQGLIESLEAEGRRLPYRITPSGSTALRDHLTVQAQTAEVGLRRLAVSRPVTGLAAS
jgi:DNA-binding PadR family transcriptional regulator